jgi:hypothetical protein
VLTQINIPPITLPGIGDIVLTDSAKSILQSSGLTGLTYTACGREKVRIVDLAWENWDLSTPEPPERPKNGTGMNHVEPIRVRNVFAKGILVNVLNPKTAIFFFAFLRNSSARREVT